MCSSTIAGGLYKCFVAYDASRRSTAVSRALTTISRRLGRARRAVIPKDRDAEAATSTVLGKEDAKENEPPSEPPCTLEVVAK